MGLGTALTILLLPEHLIAQSLSRDEVVSFINTIAKFSDAIYHIRTLSELAEEEEEDETIENLSRQLLGNDEKVQVLTLED